TVAGTPGGGATENVRAVAAAEAADALGVAAASTATTVYEYCVSAVRLLSVNEVEVVVVTGDAPALRNTRYPEMPLSSVDAVQLRLIDVADTAVALTVAGTV